LQYRDRTTVSRRHIFCTNPSWTSFPRDIEEHVLKFPGTMAHFTEQAHLLAVLIAFN